MAFCSRAVWVDLSVKAIFYFSRDMDQKEVDLVIETGDTLHPVEFKKTAIPSKVATRHFQLLEKLGKSVGHGAVFALLMKISHYQQRSPLCSLPIYSYIWLYC